MIGGLGRTTAIFSMGDVRPDRVFVEGYVVRNISWLGLFGDL